LDLLEAEAEIARPVLVECAQPDTVFNGVPEDQRAQEALGIRNRKELDIIGFGVRGALGRDPETVMTEISRLILEMRNKQPATLASLR
jgi:hypothetical protein